MPVRERALVVVCSLGTLCFVVSFAIAAALYPGGTWFDAHSAGHSLAKNFLCDLMQSRALNGQSAGIGATIARAGTVLMFVALAAFFSLVSDLESRTHASRITRTAGVFACLLGCLVPVTPSDLHRDLHVTTVLLAFAPALVATMGALVITLRSPGSQWSKVFSILTFACGAIDGIAYALAYAFAYGLIGPPRSFSWLNLLLPLMQRGAMMSVLLWIGSVVVTARRNAPQVLK